VIVLQESLGATYVESLGGLPTTPELEKLSTQGWWFEQMYATGTRSVRGIEAVVSGFMPTPAQSVVKLSLSQQNFYTLASSLKPLGYRTSFVYGGEAHFDNMRSFFTGNDFDEVIDLAQMEAAKLSVAGGLVMKIYLISRSNTCSTNTTAANPFLVLCLPPPTIPRLSIRPDASLSMTSPQQLLIMPSSMPTFESVNL
jgi:hypothetical protein